MKERPIIFTGESVRAILAGSKTQTRRILKPQGSRVWPAKCAAGIPYWKTDVAHSHGQETGLVPKFGLPGDRLWVRESFGVWARTDPTPSGQPCDPQIIYRTNDPGYWPDAEDRRAMTEPWLWRSPIYMPRRLSRLILEIVSVRVERLQDISEDDAKAEGIAEPAPVHGSWCDPARGREGHWSYRKPFAKAWDALHGKGAWEANPWVFVIGFKRIGA